MQRRQLLALDVDGRLRAIREAARPAELVRSLPAQEFYLTLVGAGVDDGGFLLALASRHQLEFVLDVGAWGPEGLEPARLARWFAAMQQSDPTLVARWLATGDETTVVLALSRLLRVYKLDESTESTFWPPDRQVPTIDGLYYFEVRDEETEDVLPVMLEALTRLRAENRQAYEGLLEQVLWVVPAEQEEEAYQLRASRLAEKGFPALDEAIDVWAAAPEASRKARAALAQRLHARAAGGPAPGAAPDVTLPVALGPPGNALARAAAALSDEQRERLVHDLVRVGNRFAVASLGHLGDPETHRDGLLFAVSHVNLAVAELSRDAPEVGPLALTELPVYELSRAGTGAVLERAWRAQRLRSGWLSRVAHADARLDEPLSAILEGLLLARPLFTGGGERRPFRAPEDLAAADAALDALEDLGEFLEQRLGAGPVDLPELQTPVAAREGPGDMEWSAVALTALAQQALGGEPRPVPLAPDAARRALAELRRPGVLRRAAADLGLARAEWLLASRLAEDTAEIGEDAPDPRFVRALLLRWGEATGPGTP